MHADISIVIPVYNSETILPILLTRLEKNLKSNFSAFEILLVNDGSKDNSWKIIKELSRKNACVRGINLRRNYGQHNALLCGIRQARYSVIITMDDDLQHPPEEIKKLTDKLSEGYDVVYGIPSKLVHSKWRNFSSRFTKLFLAKVLGIEGIKYISAFRAFKTELRDSFSQFDSPNVIIDALLRWGTDNFGVVEVYEQERDHGRSNYSLYRLIKFTMLILTGFSTVPLRFASVTGFLLTLLGIIVLIYTIIQSLPNGDFLGIPLLSSIICIFSGAQLFALGIFGEYLARVFNRSMRIPTYVIRETTNINLQQ
ncbi:MAG: glycosyltransferase family 2 protein [Anaerolineaceae bacterium]|nr:glycosyltransferase family 2 protein [Anaerolineaceae bacterium]